MRAPSAIARLAGAVLLAGGTAGCSPSLRTSPLAYGDVTGVYTNGNLRLVTERSRLQPASGRILPTVCTEPTPDHAIAFDQSGALAVNLLKLGSGAFTFDSAEEATELPGRSPGVLALRDGLYAACQSYANGVIGHDAYALILSQYSDLLIELIHAQEDTVAQAQNHVKPDASKDANTTPLPTGAAAAAEPAIRPAVLVNPTTAVGTGGAMLQVNAVPGTPAGAAAGKPAPAAAAQASDTALLAETERTREGLHAAILVACISEHDPTRIGGEKEQPKNAMLTTDYCRKFLRQAVGASAKRIEVKRALTPQH